MHTGQALVVSFWEIRPGRPPPPQEYPWIPQIAKLARPNPVAFYDAPFESNQMENLYTFCRNDEIGWPDIKDGLLL